MSQSHIQLPKASPRPEWHCWRLRCYQGRKKAGSNAGRRHCCQRLRNLMLEFTRGGNLRQLGVVVWLFPDPLQEARRFRLKKTLHPSLLETVGSPGPSRGRRHLGPHAKNGPLWMEKEHACRCLKGGRKAKSIWPRHSSWAADLGPSPGKQFSQEVRQFGACGQKMVGQLSQLLLLRVSPLRVLEAYRYCPVGRPACPYA